MGRYGGRRLAGGLLTLAVVALLLTGCASRTDATVSNKQVCVALQKYIGAGHPLKTLDSVVQLGVRAQDEQVQAASTHLEGDLRDPRVRDAIRESGNPLTIPMQQSLANDPHFRDFVRSLDQLPPVCSGVTAITWNGGSSGL
jgi:hypothetical protein